MTPITTSNVNAQTQGHGDTQPNRVGTHDNAGTDIGRRRKRRWNSNISNYNLMDAENVAENC